MYIIHPQPPGQNPPLYSKSVQDRVALIIIALPLAFIISSILLGTYK
jgi:hypothetical protein